jgi:hypothetical protein
MQLYEFSRVHQGSRSITLFRILAGILQGEHAILHSVHACEFSYPSLLSVMQKRTTRESADRRPTTTWSVCTTPKRYVQCTHSPLRSLILNSEQIARAKAIKEEFVKKVQHQAAESRKMADVLADGVITGVGLIQRDTSTDSGHSKA